MLYYQLESLAAMAPEMSPKASSIVGSSCHLELEAAITRCAIAADVRSRKAGKDLSRLEGPAHRKVFFLHFNQEHSREVFARVLA